MPVQPTGTVTFLFTDIEGSTRLWDSNPQGMRVALARHDTLLREVIEAHGGYVFKTIGDAFCATFATALAALDAALAAQRALQRETWPQVGALRARMALHTGVADIRDGDYFGPPLNRTARLLAVGHGGQILLSQATSELVMDVLPTSVTLRDLGERRLKDLLRPERVYQLVTPDLTDILPTLKTLDIRLLGDFQVRYGDQSLTGFSSPRLRSLLAYLLLHRHAPQHRQHLAFLLWPDSTEAQARTNLRKLLLQLRHILPEPDQFITQEGQTVQWCEAAPYILDVAEFERAVAQANMARDIAPTQTSLERAAALYRGELLPGLYDDWLLAERERLAQLCCTGLERLVDLLEEQRDLGRAVEYAQQLLRHDPVRETTYHTLMRLHALSDNRAGALSVYHACVTTLQHEVGADPSPTTQQLYETLLNIDTMAAPRSQPRRRLPLVGRQSEWQTLRERWAEVQSGAPHFVMLAGEAGIGKTRLVEELTDWVGRRGIATAATRCYMAEGALPYAPVVTWLRSAVMRCHLLSLEDIWATEVARLLPELLAERPGLASPQPLTESWRRQRFFEAIARVILKHEDPLLLHIDDLQWCDVETLEWLHFMLRFLRQAPLLLVGTMRTEEVIGSHPLTALILAAQREELLTEIKLGPLTAAETRELAQHLAEQDLTAQAATHLFQATEGNPLFVVETVRAGLHQAPPSTDTHLLATSSHGLPPVVPASIHAVIKHRLAQLSPPARDLAGLAAVIGREFAFEVLKQASDTDEEALLRGLDELWHRRIVREHAPDSAGSTDLYDFSHHQLREVTYTSLGPAHRRRLHGQVAQALERLYAAKTEAVSGQIGHHYAQAGLAAQAVVYYRQAADAAQRMFAYKEAIGYCRRALELLGPLASRSSASPIRQVMRETNERLGDLLHLTGDYDDARAVYETALMTLEGSDILSAARLRRKVGNIWREQYQYPQALQAYAHAEQVLGVEPDPAGLRHASTETGVADWWREWIAIQHEWTNVHYWLAEIEPALDRLRHMQPLVETYGTPIQRVRFFQLLAMIHIRKARYAPSEEAAEAAKAMSAAMADAGQTSETPSILFGLAFLLFWHVDLTEAEARIRTALSLAEQSDDISLQARCLTYLTIIFRKRGQLEAVQEGAVRSLQVAERAHMPEYVAAARAHQAWLAWREGLLSEVERHGQAALALWAQLPSGHASAVFQWLALMPLMAVALRHGHVGSAVDYARRLVAPTQERLPDNLTEHLETAIQAMDREELDQASQSLSQMLALAYDLGYI